MTRRRLLPLLLPVVLLTAACSGAQETVSTVRDCAALASDVASAGLSGVPTQAEAEAAAQRLDDRVQDLESTTVREAATTLRDRLEDLRDAAARGDAATVRDAQQQARDAAAAAAEACGVPAEQFLGTG